MKKIDLKKELKHLYLPSAKEVGVVEVPAFNFAMVDGRLPPGEPPAESLAFQNALQALYGISFTLKFMSKQREENPIDYTVMALEGLWWNDDGAFDISDPVFTLANLFSGGPDPAEPFAACGSDPTPDVLGCADFPTCP